jgi:hypothetical protein
MKMPLTSSAEAEAEEEYGAPACMQHAAGSSDNDLGMILRAWDGLCSLGSECSTFLLDDRNAVLHQTNGAPLYMMRNFHRHAPQIEALQVRKERRSFAATFSFRSTCAMDI